MNAQTSYAVLHIAATMTGYFTLLRALTAVDRRESGACTRNSQPASHRASMDAGAGCVHTCTHGSIPGRTRKSSTNGNELHIGAQRRSHVEMMRMLAGTSAAPCACGPHRPGGRRRRRIHHVTVTLRCTYACICRVQCVAVSRVQARALPQSTACACISSARA